MPIVHSASKAAFHTNVSREVAAGKPVKQAVAIAYSVKRAAGGDDDEKRAKMRHEIARRH